MQMEVLWLGKRDYFEVLELQKKKVQNLLANPSEAIYLIGCEHPDVVTLGLRGKLEDLRVTVEELEGKGVALAKVSRGGQATLHAHGQLVIYPICNLRLVKKGIRDFVNDLQEVTSQMIQGYGASLTNHPDVGVFSERGKIAFLGLRVDRGISYHGISINVTNDLDSFSLIRSCGKEFEEFDKLEFYDREISTEFVFKKWCESFKNRFFA